jgi:hypothetical protein
MQPFDFARAAEIYKENRFRWVDVGVPDEDDLRETARYLVGHIPADSPSIATGRLQLKRSVAGFELSIKGKSAKAGPLLVGSL